ncbi:laccase-like multicopper oxidase, partial [Periconia macrospinosa]
WIHASLDNHTFTVIAADFVPIEPFETKELSIGIGQRYDVLIHANQNPSSSSYWFRVGTGGWCDGPNLSANTSRGIFRYTSTSSPASPSLLASSYYDEPTSTPFAPLMSGCWDEERIVPVQKTEVPRNVPKEMEVGFSTTNASTSGVHWLIDGSAMKVDAKWPTLVKVADGVREFDRGGNVYRVGEEGRWQYWVIQQSHTHSASHLPHPIHLHGHDFFILHSSPNATWTGNTSTLNFSNPPRRDSTTLPSNGYVVLAFESDNPGVWLMHCHIPFHVEQGFGLQFVERGEEIMGTVGGLGDMRRECGDWRAFQESYYGVEFEFEDTLVR